MEVIDLYDPHILIIGDFNSPYFADYYLESLWNGLATVIDNYMVSLNPRQYNCISDFLG